MNITEVLSELLGEIPDEFRINSTSTFTESGICTLKDSTKIFCKYSTESNGKAILRAEKQGLEALQNTDVISIPEILCFYDDPDFVLLGLEWLDTGIWTEHTQSDFGERLATLHRDHRSELYGFQRNNFIGGNLQCNSKMDQWGDFFVSQRIKPQQRLGKENGWISSVLNNKIDEYTEKLKDSLNALSIFPSLLHGDLWSGNAICSSHGTPYLIDPAVYYGHREAEIAFMHFFGGFGSAVFKRYNEVYPLDAEFSNRKEIYNLYHIMNHANLFGGGYKSQVRDFF